MKSSKYIILFTVIFILIGIYFLIALFPLPYEKTFNGYIIQKESFQSDAKSVEVRFYGEYRRSKLWGENFNGDIFIDGVKIVNNERYLMPEYENDGMHKDNIKIQFNEDNVGDIITYNYDKTDGIYKYTYIGKLIINAQFSEIIILFNNDYQDSESWNNDEGKVIVAPADDSNEALKKYNLFVSQMDNMNLDYKDISFPKEFFTLSLLLLVALFVFYVTPKKIKKKYEGFQLSDNEIKEKKVTVLLNGKYYNNKIAGKYFLGYMKIMKSNNEMTTKPFRYDFKEDDSIIVKPSSIFSKSTDQNDLKISIKNRFMEMTITVINEDDHFSGSTIVTKVK
ncbi:MAG: hypothetical protein JXQ23_01560 [Clostridia bacterium]|nr:hypothetical protein [Clostridia bacterium]